jgi:hypothetical protein
MAGLEDPNAPRREQLQADHDAALIDLREAVGAVPIEVSTAGELAALLARVPAGTPLVVGDHVRVDPDLDEGSTSSRTAVQATAISTFADERVYTVDEHGERDVYGRPIAAVLLSAVLTAQDSAAPSSSVAYGPYERLIEALYDGDGAVMVDEMAELVRHAAGYINGIDDVSLFEWLTDKDLAAQLEVEGNRLMQAAARLAALRARVAADLAAQDDTTPDGSGD